MSTRDKLHRTENWVRPVARLDIPLESVVNLRRIAGLLRGLAVQLDHMSREQGEVPEILFAAGEQVRHTNRELAKVRRSGRPRKVWNEAQWKPTLKHKI